MSSEPPERKRVTKPLENPRLAEAILDHAGMLILVLDLSGRIVRFNHACELLTGYSEAEAQGRRSLDLFIPPDELGELTGLFEQWGKGHNLPNRRTNFVVTRTGQRRLISWTNTAIPASDNDPGYILSFGEDITEAHLLEQRINEALELNEKILATVPVGITVYRTDGQCILATEMVEPILHASHAQILGQNFRQLESWRRTGLLQAAEETLATGQTHTISVHTTSTFGHEVWLECRTAAFQLDGQPHLLLTTDDVSRQHKVEAELRNAENRYRTLVEQIPAVTYIAALDEHSSTLYYSPQVDKLLGYTPAEMLQDPDLWRNQVHPDDLEPTIEAVRQNSGSGKPVHSEYRIRRKDGREIWVSDDANFVRDERGKPQYLQGVMVDITGERQVTQELERRIAERTAQLHQSEQNLRTFIDALPDAAFLIRLDGRVLGANQAVSRWFDRTPEQMIGSNFFEYLPPELIASYRNQLEQLTATHEPQEFEDSRNGRITLNRIYPVANPQGELYALAFIAIDITDRKHNEEELYASRQMLRLVIDSIPQHVFWKDRESRYLGANRPFIERSPFARIEDLIGKTDYDLASPADADKYRGDDREILATGTPKLNYDEMQHQRDGSVTWARTNKLPLHDQAGHIFGVLGIYEDITERKRLETELQESEERFRSAFEQAAVGIVQIASDGQFIRFNQRACEIFGYSEQELLTVDYTKIVYPEDMPEMLAQMQSLSEGKASSIVMEMRFLHKDGSLVWTVVSVSVVGQPGNPNRYIAIIEDITTRKQAQALLEERTLDLARSNADLEQFAYIVSHDLQEPLRMVSSFAQLLARRYESQLDQRADEYIHYVTEGAQRMQHLIDDLLAYSRVGTRGKAFTAVQTEKVLAQALENLHVAIDEQDIQITHDPLPTVQGDEIQLVQLFQNLIANAIKFHSAEPPRIHIAATRKDQDWVFSVRDNGIGIDPKYFERIFVIFQRLHLRTEYPGTGIGLAICKKIVGRHNGRIWVDSAPGQGSTFFFTLPWTLSASS